MRIDLFQMERTQCLFENIVDFNLSESAVLPLRVEELLDGEFGAEKFLSQALRYPESGGSFELRERIAQWYGQGATAEHVLVTNGGSEANFTVWWGLLEWKKTNTPR